MVKTLCTITASTCGNELVFQFNLLTLHLFEAFLLHTSIESGYCTCLCLLSLRLPRRFGCVKVKQ